MNLLENQRAADQVAGLYQDLEELLMSNIIRHCQNWDQPIASDTWLLQKLAEIGKLDKENIQIIAKHTGLSMTAMERMLQEAAEDAIGQLEPGMQELARRKLVGEAVDAVKEVGGQMFICADHGNAEQLIDEETGEPFTAHTTNPVPFILVNADPAYKLREGGCLADIAPTLIELMGMQQPADMTGKSLLVK